MPISSSEKRRVARRLAILLLRRAAVAICDEQRAGHAGYQWLHLGRDRADVFAQILDDHLAIGISLQVANDAIHDGIEARSLISLSW